MSPHDIVRPIIVAILAAALAHNNGCLPYGESISPADAYAMEVSGCVQKRNDQVLQCAKTAPTVPAYVDCRADAEETERKCRSAVDRKYLGYNSEGGYPAPNNPPPAR